MTTLIESASRKSITFTPVRGSSASCPRRRHLPGAHAGEKHADARVDGGFSNRAVRERVQHRQRDWEGIPLAIAREPATTTPITFFANARCDPTPFGSRRSAREWCSACWGRSASSCPCSRRGAAAASTPATSVRVSVRLDDNRYESVVAHRADPARGCPRGGCVDAASERGSSCRRARGPRRRRAVRGPAQLRGRLDPWCERLGPARHRLLRRWHRRDRRARQRVHALRLDSPAPGRSPRLPLTTSGQSSTTTTAPSRARLHVPHLIDRRSSMGILIAILVVLAIVTRCCCSSSVGERTHLDRAGLFAGCVTRRRSTTSDAAQPHEFV